MFDEGLPILAVNGLMKDGNARDIIKKMYCLWMWEEMTIECSATTLSRPTTHVVSATTPLSEGFCQFIHLVIDLRY